MKTQTSKNVFEKNPKKTIVIFLIIVFMILMIGFEKYFNSPHIQVIHKGKQRYIQLREHGPSFYAKMIPSNEDMKVIDGLKQKEYILRTDNNGFILPSKIHEEADVTIVFLGGSTTECAFVEEESRFPYLVGRLLEQDLKMKVNSYNAGMSGNNTMHSIDILLNKVLAYQPSIVVMMENINDLVMLLIEKNYWSQNPTRSLIIEKKFSMTNSIGPFFNKLFPNLAYFIQTRRSLSPDEFKNQRGKKIIIQKEKLLNEFSMNLQTFIDICKIRHIIPVLMTQENRFTTKPGPTIENYTKNLLLDYDLSYNEFKTLIDDFNEVIRNVGKRNHILVVDLAKEIPQTNEYIYDTVHMNTRGSILAAQKIKQAIESLIVTTHAVVASPAFFAGRGNPES